VGSPNNKYNVKRTGNPLQNPLVRMVRDVDSRAPDGAVADLALPEAANVKRQLNQQPEIPDQLIIHEARAAAPPGH
jgi:hypothetical protein